MADEEQLQKKLGAERGNVQIDSLLRRLSALKAKITELERHLNQVRSVDG